MKVLSICGSPRGAKSQTRTMAEALLSGAKAGGAEVELVDLGKVHIDFCVACEACHRGPDCGLHDDVGGILRKMLQADAIVLASPVYLDHVTAQMKALLDRTSHYIHCLRLTGKYTAAVTTSGGGPCEATVDFLRRYTLTVGAQFAGAVHAALPLSEARLDEARHLGTALAKAIAERKTWPDQIANIDAQRAYFGRIIAFHKDQWPYEHKYWQEKGWL